jgi:hypothetical protein
MFPHHALLLGFWSEMQYPRLVSGDNEIQVPIFLFYTRSYASRAGNPIKKSILKKYKIKIS